MTYSEMVDKVTKMASALRKRGLKPQDAVLLMASNHIELAVAKFAIMKAGGFCACLTLSLFTGKSISSPTAATDAGSPFHCAPHLRLERERLLHT